MQYRTLGNTGIKVSEIGFGGEWMDGTLEETIAVTRACEDGGINILDCWMPDPTRRSNLGDALQELDSRERWIIQGHLGSTWQGEQYVRTRDLDQVKPAFEDLLQRFHTDYMDLGMIHYVHPPRRSFHSQSSGGQARGGRAGHRDDALLCEPGVRHDAGER